MAENKTTSNLDQSEDVNILDEFDKQKISRRQALRRLGIASSMGVLSLTSLDDVFRAVGVHLSRINSDRAVVNSIAQDLSNAGVAVADPVNRSFIYMGTHDPNSPNFSVDCQDRCDNHLLGALHDLLDGAGEEVKKCIKSSLRKCAKDHWNDAAGVKQCIIDAVKNCAPEIGELDATNAIHSYNYMLCCYFLCDGPHVEGWCCCEYGKTRTNQKCADGIIKGDC